MVYRLRDIVLSLLVLLIFSWLFLLIILLLALTQQRVFFLQERTGYKQKPFTLIKFSTLRDIVPGEREEDDQRKRLTPAGKLLRRLSLDEFPQLFNVLAGQMSLVGPRPLIHEYLPLYDATALRRFEVRPGITGWAQVNGRNKISFKARFQLDVWYVDHRSFGLDLRIFWRTFTGLFRKQDIYVDEQTTAPKYDGTN